MKVELSRVRMAWGDAVAFVLALDQPFGFQFRVDEVLEQVVQQPGGLDHVVGCGLKQVEEGLIAGKDSQPHGLYLPVKGNRLDARGRSGQAFGIHRFHPDANWLARWFVESARMAVLLNLGWTS